MKFVWLGIRGLFYRPIRSFITLLSIAVAFLLFGLVEGIDAGYREILDAQFLDRLFVEPRVVGGHPIPLAAAQRIKEVAGVTRVCPRVAFHAHYQQPSNTLFALATNAADWLAVRPEYSIDPSILSAMDRTRAGIVMTHPLMNRFGLEVGDRVPLHSQTLQKNGSAVWIFELLGTFELREGPTDSEFALINFSYFDEARLADTGTVDRIIVRIDDPARAAQVGRSIDRLFENSSHRTRTQNEKEDAESWIRQIGDIQLFTGIIATIVLVTLLFVTSNTFAHAATERSSWFALLRSLGFSKFLVAGLIVIEAEALCLAGAALGLVLAVIAMPAIREMFGPAEFSSGVAMSGIAMATAIAIASSLWPALKACQMPVADGLRAH